MPSFWNELAEKLTWKLQSYGVLPWPKKKTATWIMHKIRTVFLSWDIEKSSLIALRCSDARSRGQPLHHANLMILRDKSSVLILCMIQVAVFFFFFFGQGSTSSICTSTDYLPLVSFEYIVRKINTTALFDFFSELILSVKLLSRIGQSLHAGTSTI